MEKGGGNVVTNTREDEEDQWEDVDSMNLISNGRRAEEGTETRPSTGRPGGRGRRGYWVRRREDQLKKSIKANAGSGGTSPEKTLSSTGLNGADRGSS